MRSLAKVVAVLLLLFYLYTAPSTAEIKSVKIRSYDSGWFLLDYFKFTRTGLVSIMVSSISVTSNISRPDPSLFGFYLLSDEAKFLFDNESKLSNISCSLHSKFIILLFTFQDLPQYTSFNKSYPITYPDGYSLYFSNCNRPLSHLTMNVRTELYTIDNGETKDYLSAGATELPRLYFNFSLIYVCFLGFWIFVCLTNHKSCYMVHILMGVLLITKAINLFCEAEVQHSVKVTGTRSYGWNVLFYIFEFITPALFYTVITIIHDRSYFLKPKENVSLMIVIPLQVLATVLSKEIGEVIGEPPFSVYGLLMVETLLRIYVIMPMVCSACDTYINDIGQDARNYVAKLTPYLWFLGVYLFINLGLSVVVNKMMNYPYHWQSNAAEEIISLVFYILMFFMFMPSEKQEYFDQLEEATAVKEVEL